MSTPDREWFLAGLGDGATHYGVWSPVTRSILAVCGAEFISKYPALPGAPPDREQICPECANRRRAIRA